MKKITQAIYNHIHYWANYYGFRILTVSMDIPKSIRLSYQNKPQEIEISRDNSSGWLIVKVSGNPQTIWTKPTKTDIRKAFLEALKLMGTEVLEGPCRKR